MANSMLSLLDITKQNGTDMAVGLVEEIRTFAPEVEVLMGRPINGTSYHSRVRTSLPTGPAFRQANAGSDTVSSKYDIRLNECFYLDGQMQIDEAVAESSELGQDVILAQEALGVFKQKAIALGAQLYYGTSQDASGFPGFTSLWDTAMTISVQSATASTSSAWLVVNSLDGVHLIYGKNSGLNVRQWTRQQVLAGNSKPMFAWVNNLSGWVGLSFNYSKSLCRISGLSDGAATGLTDKMVAKALSLFPVGTVPTHLFMNRTQRYMLQQSRAPVYAAATLSNSNVTSNLPLQFPAMPVESNGIPIYVTDSITNTETSPTITANV